MHDAYQLIRETFMLGYLLGDLGDVMEWNNKDPFFDRDLINFQALHHEGRGCGWRDRHQRTGASGPHLWRDPEPGWWLQIRIFDHPLG